MSKRTWFARIAGLMALSVFLQLPPGARASDFNPATVRPVVTWATPNDASSFPAYSIILLYVNASEAGGTIKQVFFLSGTNNQVIGTATNFPWSMPWGPAQPGTYILKALAQDTAGIGTMSVPINVTILPAATRRGTSPPPTTNSTPPPPPSATLYALTVNGGTGGGSFAAGTVVSINASAPPAGQVFSQWTGAGVLNSSSPSTSLTMPAGATSVTATYAPVTYSLTVNGGSGGGKFSAGTVIWINANAAPAGQVFSQWTGAAVANSSSPGTSLTMPASAVSVTATYQPLTYALTVNGGSGGGSYQPGAVVTINAGTAPSGQVFAQWTGAPVANAAATSTTLVMPPTAATVSATYNGVVPTGPTNPILFVTQIPIGFDYTTVASVFSNHKADPDSCGRGGDLYIRFPDGTLKNLTGAAGYGVATGLQGANGIAVREPSVHWSGQKALFSMVVGSPTTQYAASSSFWQVYEITGLGQYDTPVITKIPNQPSNYNNVAPFYGTDGRILFVSDRPRNGQPQLYPQLDEYELAQSTTGVWSLDPATGDLFNLDHTPSGAFSPSIDSFGRVVFVRWDHLQRDQEADIDVEALSQGQPLTYGTFNYTDESANAGVLFNDRTEVYPEARTAVGNANGHVFNFFFPWMINQDGTQEETINHVGRHEIAGYLVPSFRDDPNLQYFYNPAARYNQTYINNFLQIKEDPANPGRYFGTDAPEFTSHASGQLVALNAPAGMDADVITMDYITDPVTKTPLSPAPAGHSGHFREPLPMSDGTLVAVHADGTDVETQRGVGSDYAFRLKTLWRPGTYWVPYQPLTTGISKSVSYYDGSGGTISYTGPLWELNPVEVRSRPIPQGAITPLPAPEQQIFAEVGVDVSAFQGFMRSNGLALVVSRNLTTRDHADKQQPYNLHVAGTSTQTLGAAGKIYDIQFLQFLQADQLRGYGMRTPASSPNPGRRVLAEPMHDPMATSANPPAPGPVGSVQLGADGSMAAFVPARRAMTWQLTDPAGSPVVRERYWLTFQPGEIRSCTSCHGVNTHDQANNPPPVNAPAALRTLLQSWKAAQTGP